MASQARLFHFSLAKKRLVLFFPSPWLFLYRSIITEQNIHSLGEKEAWDWMCKVVWVGIFPVLCVLTPETIPQSEHILLASGLCCVCALAWSGVCISLKASVFPLGESTNSGNSSQVKHNIWIVLLKGTLPMSYYSHCAARTHRVQAL